jgi:hypothetical protein
MNTENEDRKIVCPECGTEIDVDALLRHQVEEELRSRFESQMAKEQKKIEKKSAELAKSLAEIEERKKSLEESIKEGVKKELQTEKEKLEERIRKTVQDENAESIRMLQNELSRKSEQVKDLNRARTEILRLTREKDELKEAVEAEAERKLNQMLKEEREKLNKAAEERAELKISEKEHLIEQLRVQLKDAQRKAEQGSMQAQGEVQEIAIEEWLKESFPLDTIQEIKKGVRGADCLQIVNTRTRRNVGSIYYESKRTKDFQATWIGKFKEDLRANGANIGVIVTEAMPRDMSRMGLKEGIWICSFEEFKGLSAVLRDSVIQISNAVVSQENKGDKMSLLYDYLTSNEFRLQIEAIVEGFTQLQTDLNAEKRAMESAWKRREKQIDKVLLSTNHMYSSIRGIAGSAVPVVAQLEFKNMEDDGEDQ